jgi:hypothetical protein
MLSTQGWVANRECGRNQLKQYARCHYQFEGEDQSHRFSPIGY